MRNLWQQIMSARKRGRDLLCVWVFLFCVYLLTACTADVGTPNYPIYGSRQQWPDTTGDYNYRNSDLTRLLDVGACQSSDTSISFVPPLDGASPIETLCQDTYAMKMVLFDLQLVELKSVDPVGGSFRCILQIVLHWVDSIIPGANGSDYLNGCSFLCDTASPRPTCCDEVWVPPLRLFGCDINNIGSATRTPYVYVLGDDVMSTDDCFLQKNYGECIWRRLWYLNIDATCMSHMDFHNFPFDLQDLTLDLINPYASRTWFQLTKGFLRKNIGENINGVSLSPDSKISGWYIKDVTVSSTCGVSQTWLQTFLAQDKLLSALGKNYESQRSNITIALNLKDLTCSKMENFNMSKDDENLISPANLIPYLNAVSEYEKRLNSTLVEYKQCIQARGQNFSWNTTILTKGDQKLEIPEFGFFNTSIDNIRRSFSLLDLERDEKSYKVWAPCAIDAIANLTMPAIRVTIRVQRYRMFYVVKLILPTIACVAFTFSAFGLQPHELMGRLTVVVPSVIALTALQGLVVSSDIPPVAYIAPSTYIILISYTIQVLIAFESILVDWLLTRRRPKFLQRIYRMHGERAPPSQRLAPIMHTTSNNPFSIQSRVDEHQGYPISATRIFDLLFMGFLVLLYAIAILVCTLLPWHHSEMTKRHDPIGSISIWKYL